jgi:hypothetical protein
LCDRVLDNLEQFFGTSRGANRQLMKQLHHQSREPLECSRDANGGVDLNKDTLRRLNINLQLASLVDG